MILERDFMGPEPEFTKDEPLTQSQLAKAYNWYSYYIERKVTGGLYVDPRAFTLDYLRSQKTGPGLIKLLGSLPIHKFATIGWQSRLLLRGHRLPPESLEYFKSKISLLIEEAKEIKKTKEKESAIARAEPVNLTEVVTANADFNQEMDRFFDSGYNNELDVYAWLRKYKPIGVKTILACANYLKEELDLIKKDKEIAEGYRNISKKNMKAYAEFVLSIISNATTILDNNKRARKPRAKKAKSAEKVVKKLNYKQEDTALKIKSIAPEAIVGATQLWTYNTKTRKLSCYNANAGEVLSIKGTTITGTDPKDCSMKNLRKPEDILQNVVTGGKITLRHMMDNIKAKAAVPKNRINKDTLLLRAIHK